MTIHPVPNTEKRFNLGAWLILSIAIVFFVFSFADLAYRLTLPTDGWEVNEANDLPGFNYSKNLMGNYSPLQAGDQVVAVEGIPADWQTMPNSPKIIENWRTGTTLDYTILRGGQEIHEPVTLFNWQIGKWLQVTLQDAGKMVGLLSGLVLLALAGFIFLRQPGNPATGPFLIVMAILASSRVSETLNSGFSGWLDPLANFLSQIIKTDVLLVIMPFALIRFAFVFPHPKPIHQRYPWLSWGIGGVGIILAVFAIDSPVIWFWFVFSLFLALAILIHNAFTMRDAVSRAQMLWGLGGLMIGFGTLALMFLAGTLGLFVFAPQAFELFDLASSLAMMVMGSMLAVGILRYRLYDIDVIIRKTLQYTLLTGSLVLVYFGNVLLLQNLVETLTGEQSPVVIVISTLGIAALFNPLRLRIQDFIDRHFYRRKYDTQQALAAFAAVARDEVDMEKLTSALLNVVEETMQPERLSFWVKPAKKLKTPDIT